MYTAIAIQGTPYIQKPMLKTKNNSNRLAYKGTFEK